jgi:hypothetical protein
LSPRPTCWQGVPNNGSQRVQHHAAEARRGSHRAIAGAALAERNDSGRTEDELTQGRGASARIHPNSIRWGRAQSGRAKLAKNADSLGFARPASFAARSATRSRPQSLVGCLCASRAEDAPRPPHIATSTAPAAPGPQASGSVRGLARQLKDLGRFLYLSCWRPVEMKTLLVGLSTLPGCAVRPRSANSNTKHAAQPV